jgi:hypothetical protein
MKKHVYTILLGILVLAFSGCNNSKKGSWSIEDKKSFQEKCQSEVKKQSGAGLEVKLCSCMESKYEKNYDSWADVPKNEKKIGGECATEMLKEAGF